MLVLRFQKRRNGHNAKGRSGKTSFNGKKCKRSPFTFGEKPDVYRDFRKILNDLGYRSFIDYVVEMNRLAISYGLLPTQTPVFSAEKS